MKARALLITAIALLNVCGSSFGQVLDASAYTLEGKWNQCSIELKKSQLEFDTTHTCPGEWDYDIKSDGTYRENYVEECNGKKFNGHGTWLRVDQLLSLNSIVSDCDKQLEPLDIEMTWLTKDLFVWVQQIGEKRWRYTYFRRVGD